MESESRSAPAGAEAWQAPAIGPGEEDRYARREKLARKVATLETLGNSGAIDIDPNTAEISDAAWKEIKDFENQAIEQYQRYQKLVTLEHRINKFLKKQNAGAPEIQPAGPVRKTTTAERKAESLGGKVLTLFKRITASHPAVETAAEAAVAPKEADQLDEIKMLAAEAGIAFQESVDKMLPAVKQAQEATALWKEKVEEMAQDRRGRTEIMVERQKRSKPASPDEMREAVPSSEELEQVFEDITKKN